MVGRGGGYLVWIMAGGVAWVVIVHGKGKSVVRVSNWVTVVIGLG